MHIWGYWRGPVWNCWNKIQLLLPLSTSHMTKKIGTVPLRCIAIFPTTSGYPPILFIYTTNQHHQNTINMIMHFFLLFMSTFFYMKRYGIGPISFAVYSGTSKANFVLFFFFYLVLQTTSLISPYLLFFNFYT